MKTGVSASELVARDSAVVWHPYTQMLTRPQPLPIARGEGIYLYTEDGRRLLDGFSSWWVNIHGHSHPRLNEALANQARQLEHVVFANCTHRPAVELAERLLSVLPGGLARVFYSDNGSTAVEVALKLALQYWSNRGQPERKTFLTLRHAYHGDTVGAMSASEDSLFTQPFRPMLFDVVRAHAPYCYRCPMGLERASCQIECLGTEAGGAGRAGRAGGAGRAGRAGKVGGAGGEILDAVSGTLAAQLTAHEGRVAAVLIEPMLQAAGGMIVWPREFLEGVRRLCDRHGTLFIADEVLTGFGRTGRMFACEHAGVSPDIICLSKALTGGYMPLGATVVSSDVYDAFLSEDRTRTFFHGHSFTANPLACAVALESLNLFRDEPVLERVMSLERWLKDGLEPLRNHPLVGDVRVIGGVGILELVTDRASRAAGGYLDHIGPRLTAAFLERGVLLRPLGNVLYVMPPYVITQAETAWLIDQISAVLRDVSKDGLVP
ncbi:MAG: aspartate aminotransferase family protein [Vicinamibacterales bacterium]